MIEQLTEWVESNPLRKWRRAKGVTAIQAAALLEVSPYTIQMWEKGATTPSAGHLAAIAKLIDDGQHWAAWQNERPRP